MLGDVFGHRKMLQIHLKSSSKPGATRSECVKTHAPRSHGDILDHLANDVQLMATFTDAEISKSL